MHQSTITAAVLLALAPSALAMGSATVINNCGFPIYYDSVGQASQAANMKELQGSYSQVYSQEGNGVSIKLSTSANGPVSQFEITLGDGKIFYDVSNIDGSPFLQQGMSLMPSMSGDSSNPTCQPASCDAGATVCPEFYNAPNDVRTLVCSDQSDLTLTICPGGAQSRSATPSQASTNAAPSPSPSPASTNAAPAAPAAPAPAASSSTPNYVSADGSGYASVRHLTAPAWAGRFHPRHLPKK